MTIVTHTSPDFDAIGAAWLLKRYGGMADHEVVFVNTGNPDPAVLEAADAVVDTGRVFDPKRRRFDHHQLPGTEANETCAAHQVYMSMIVENIHDKSTFRELHAISPLVRLIYYGDTGKAEANESRMLGIHAMLSNQKRQGADDRALLAYGLGILDTLAQSLISQDEARRSLSRYTVYRSNDGLLVALRDAPEGASSAAHEAGARLVVFGNYAENAIGIWRAGECQEPHCGALVAAVCADTIIGPVDEAIVSELLTWYRHEAGFFAGRGTKKAPREDPIIPDLAAVAAALDRSWKR